MKKILLSLLLYSFCALAQSQVPRFKNDTLYTTSGFKIYVGQTLFFGKGSGTNGKYKHVNIISGATSKALANTSVFITALKNYGMSVLHNGYINIIGTITYKDGSKSHLEVHVSFDRAIENSLKLPSEILVPDEYRNKPWPNTSDELIRLYKEYLRGDLTEEEYDEQKKKVLERHQ